MAVAPITQVATRLVVVSNYEAELKQETEEINSFFTCPKEFKNIGFLSKKLYENSYYKISI